MAYRVTSKQAIGIKHDKEYRVTPKQAKEIKHDKEKKKTNRQEDENGPVSLAQQVKTVSE